MLFGFLGAGQKRDGGVRGWGRAAVVVKQQKGRLGLTAVWAAIETS
jgi:hypothetical protein